MHIVIVVYSSVSWSSELFLFCPQQVLPDSDAMADMYEAAVMVTNWAL